MYVLEVLNGPLDGKTWRFEREIVIGRDESAADACLPLDRYVSRRHARVRVDGAALILEDLQSRNGTRVGEHPVSGAVELPPGTPFVVGRTLLRVVPE
jgi:pSer/pThr/pTyr-binding forkhead associated (FHA) protein